MEQDELQALLRQLRASQDGPAREAAQAGGALGAGPSAPSQDLDELLAGLVPANANAISGPTTSIASGSAAVGVGVGGVPSQSELAALLHSLQAPINTSGLHHAPTPPVEAPTPGQSRARERDLTQLSFPESLPILQRLSGDERFMRGLEHVRAAQDKMEVDLKGERDKLIKELNRTVGRSVILAGLPRGSTSFCLSSGALISLVRGVARPLRSPHMRASRLKEWDRKALTRWAKHKADQQKALQNVRPRALSSPTMSETSTADPPRPLHATTIHRLTLTAPPDPNYPSAAAGRAHLLGHQGPDRAQAAGESHHGARELSGRFRGPGVRSGVRGHWGSRDILLYHTSHRPVISRICICVHSFSRATCLEGMVWARAPSSNVFASDCTWLACRSSARCTATTPAPF